MGATFLVVLLFASVFSASSSSSQTTQCSQVGAQVLVATRSQTRINLSCRWNDGGSLVAFEDVDVAIGWYYNSTVEITNRTGVAGDGIDYTIKDFRKVRNAVLTISLPDDHSRIRAEGNYSCGCTDFSERGAQVLIVEPFQDQNLPRFYAAEIGKPYNLYSPYDFGANRHKLNAGWRKGNQYFVGKSDEPMITGYYVRPDLSLHIANVTVDDAGDYQLQLSYRSQDRDQDIDTTSDSITLIPFRKPVLQPLYSRDVRLVLYNGVLKGEMTTLEYTHLAEPLQYATTVWEVVNTVAYRTGPSGERTSTFSFVQDELEEELDGPLSVIKVTYCAMLNISKSRVYYKDNATVSFHILKLSQSQHFQVVFERTSFRVLQAKITYRQPLPTGYDFEIVFFSAGEKIHTAAGATDTDSQVILISLDNVDTLSSITARMEFVYSEDRFAGPEMTSAIPVFCPECIVGAVSGTVLLVVGCIVILAAVLAFRKYRQRRRKRKTSNTFPDYCGPRSGTPNPRSRRASSMSDYPMAFYPGNGLDHGNLAHPSNSCMFVAVPMNESYGYPHVFCPIRSSRASSRVTRPHDHCRECNSALPEECHEPHVSHQPPMRQRSYSDGQLADSYQIQRLQEVLPAAVHHYDVPRRTSTRAPNNEWIREVPRSSQRTSELDSAYASTGVQSNRPLISTRRNNGGLSSRLGSECGDVVDTGEN